MKGKGLRSISCPAKGQSRSGDRGNGRLCLCQHQGRSWQVCVEPGWCHPHPCAPCACSRCRLGNLGTAPGAQTFQRAQEEMAKTPFSLICSALCCYSSGRSRAGRGQGCGDTVLQPPRGFGHETFLGPLDPVCPLCVCFTCHKRLCLAAVSPKPSILCELQGLQQPVLVEVVPACGRMELNDHEGPFPPKPLQNSLVPCVLLLVALFSLCLCCQCLTTH